MRHPRRKDVACLGVEMVRTRRLPAWTGIAFLVAAVLLFGARPEPGPS